MPRITLRRIAPIAVTLVLAVSATGLAGCASEASPSGSADADAPVTVALVQNQTNVPFQQTARWGAEAAGVADGNAEVTVAGPTIPTAANASSTMQSLLTSLQPDGFVTNPCFLEALGPVLNDVVRETDGNASAYTCRPILTKDGKSPIRTYVGVNDFETGRQAVKAAIEASGLTPDTTGTALIAKCVDGVPILEDQRAGALAEVKEALPNVEAEVFITDTGQSGADAKWASAFSKHSDVVIAYGSCDQDAAALLGMKRQGVGGDFVTTAQNPDARILDAIENGSFAAAVATGPWVQANVAVRLMIDGARGTAAPEGFVDIGIRPITKDNVADFRAATESAEAAEAFFGPWADEVMADLPAFTKPMSDTVPE